MSEDPAMLQISERASSVVRLAQTRIARSRILLVMVPSAKGETAQRWLQLPMDWP